jgi:GNAT superfamily N-acetyltransferase
MLRDPSNPGRFESGLVQLKVRLRPAQNRHQTRAGSIFRELDMDAIADDEAPSTVVLAALQAAGRMWVATDDADEPVAYLLVQVIDGGAHIEQVSVHPRAARQGLGRALIESAASWARQRGLKALTLTTYRDVPWNRPHYERLGFQIVGTRDFGKLGRYRVMAFRSPTVR